MPRVGLEDDGSSDDCLVLLEVEGGDELNYEPPSPGSSESSCSASSSSSSPAPAISTPSRPSLADIVRDFDPFAAAADITREFRRQQADAPPLLNSIKRCGAGGFGVEFFVDVRLAKLNKAEYVTYRSPFQKKHYSRTDNLVAGRSLDPAVVEVTSYVDSGGLPLQIGGSSLRTRPVHPLPFFAFASFGGR